MQFVFSLLKLHSLRPPMTTFLGKTYHFIAFHFIAFQQMAILIYLLETFSQRFFVLTFSDCLPIRLLLHLSCKYSTFSYSVILKASHSCLYFYKEPYSIINKFGYFWQVNKFPSLFFLIPSDFTGMGYSSSCIFSAYTITFSPVHIFIYL